MTRLTAERASFLRLFAPDAIARQINAAQLSTMMTYAFVLNRNPPLSLPVEGACGRVGGASATVALESVILATSAAAGIAGSLEGTTPVSGRKDVRRRGSGDRRSSGRGDAGLSAQADGYEENMFKVSFSDLDRILAFPLVLFLQMAADPSRPLDPSEVEVAKVVFGRDRNGSVSEKVEPFKGCRPDTVEIEKVKPHLVARAFVVWRASDPDLVPTGRQAPYLAPPHQLSREPMPEGDRTPAFPRCATNVLTRAQSRPAPREPTAAGRRPTPATAKRRGAKRWRGWSERGG